MKVMNQEFGQNWAMYNGDCVEVLSGMPDESVDFSIFSPPFSSLYTFSNDERNMSNVKTHEEFFQQYDFFIEQLARVMKQGRIVATHCMDLTTGIGRDGFLSIIDFRGMLIKAMQKHGFYYHSEITIWKNPVVEVTRTKNIQLLYHQFCKDATISRMALPDRLICFRKAGENKVPVTHDREEFSPTDWGEIASPVWMDIKQTNTLNGRIARDEKDEKHISCLQLDVIDRAVKMWSNPNEVVLSPFGGIGSEGYQSLKCGRKFIGIELKESYYKQAVANLKIADSEVKNQTQDLFTA